MEAGIHGRVSTAGAQGGADRADGHYTIAGKAGDIQLSRQSRRPPWLIRRPPWLSRQTWNREHKEFIDGLKE